MHTNGQCINACTWSVKHIKKDEKAHVGRSSVTILQHFMTCQFSMYSVQHIQHTDMQEHIYISCLHLIFTEFSPYRNILHFCNSHLLATYAHMYPWIDVQNI